MPLYHSKCTFQSVTIVLQGAHLSKVLYTPCIFVNASYTGSKVKLKTDHGWFTRFPFFTSHIKSSLIAGVNPLACIKNKIKKRYCLNYYNAFKF